MSLSFRIRTAYANHTILTPPLTRSILWHLRSLLISVAQEQNWSALIRSEKPRRALQRLNVNYLSFKNLQILRTISSRYDVNHTLNSLQRPSRPISSLGVYYNRWWLSNPFRADVRVHNLTMTLELKGHQDTLPN